MTTTNTELFSPSKVNPWFWGHVNSSSPRVQCFTSSQYSSLSMQSLLAHLRCVSPSQTTEREFSDRRLVTFDEFKVSSCILIDAKVLISLQISHMEISRLTRGLGNSCQCHWKPVFWNELRLFLSCAPKPRHLEAATTGVEILINRQLIPGPTKLVQNLQKHNRPVFLCVCVCVCVLFCFSLHTSQPDQH